MQLPFSKRIIYRKNPLVGVMCQLNFPRILRIGSEPPVSFQDLIRQQYPTFQETRGMNLSISVPPGIANALNFPMQLGNTAYQFIDDRTPARGVWTVSLTQDALSISTSKYERWEDFKEHIIQPLQAFVEIYKPAFFTRTGLRYQNIIIRSKLGIADTPWKELFNPHIAGMFMAVDDEPDVENSQTQVVLSLDEERKVLVQHSLVIAQDTQERCYLIDNDFYTERRTEVPNAVTILDSLNQASGRLFRWCITERLHTALVPDTV